MPSDTSKDEPSFNPAQPPAPASSAPEHEPRYSYEDNDSLSDDEAISRAWALYLEKTERIDKQLVGEWKGDMDGILIFTGLFSATVATFIIESYKSLQPDPSTTTNALLAQISQQLNNGSAQHPLITLQSTADAFQPSRSSIRVNALWLLSLCLSVSCALTAIMVQQWGRRYMHFCNRPQGTAGLQGRIRAYVFEGINKYRLSDVVETIPSLLHVSVFLFFAGLVEFFFPINTSVALVALVFLIIFGTFFGALTFLPFVRVDSPYSTPVTTVLWRVMSLLVNLYHIAAAFVIAMIPYIWDFVTMRAPIGGNAWRKYWSRAHVRSSQRGRRFLVRPTEAVEYTVEASRLGLTDSDALIWTLTEPRLPLHAMPDFFAGVTAHVLRDLRFMFPLRRENAFARSLLDSGFLRSRLRRMVYRCRLEDARDRKAAVVSMRTVWALAAGCRSTLMEDATMVLPALRMDENYLATLLWLSDHPDHTVSLPARCCRAIAWDDAYVGGKASASTRLHAAFAGVDPDRLEREGAVRSDGVLLALCGLVEDMLPHVAQFAFKGEYALFLLCGAAQELSRRFRTVAGLAPVQPSPDVAAAFTPLLERVRRLALHVSPERDRHVADLKGDSAFEMHAGFAVLADVLVRVQRIARGREMSRAVDGPGTRKDTWGDDRATIV